MIAEAEAATASRRRSGIWVTGTRSAVVVEMDRKLGQKSGIPLDSHCSATSEGPGIRETMIS